jgi:hypothetical protein
MITIPSQKAGAKQTAIANVLPPPTYGMDTRHPLAQMPPNSCVYAYNIVPNPYGMEVRKGFREFAVDIPIGAEAGENGVKTLIHFVGTVEGTITDDRLFAVSNVGIFDITDDSIAPVLKYAFNITTGKAGNGVSCHYIDQGGAEFMLYADEENGLIIYTEATDTWLPASGITGGLIPDRIVYVVVHKLRIWFVERNTGDAWYMPVSSLQGDATKFTFGSKFAHGGYLRGLYTWTFDGGSGVDDYLVAISSGGDVLPYKGEDPSSAETWSLVGSYYVGGVPIGRRIASESGGMLFVLSSYGLISMNDLLTGVDTRDISATGVASRIAPIIRAHMKETEGLYGWELIFAPTEGLYVVNSPPRPNKLQLQYVMDSTTKGWAIWRGIPMMCMVEANRKMYFGYKDTVYALEGHRDNVRKEITQPGDRGTAIEFSLLTSYSDMGAPALTKLVQFIRPNFLHMLSLPVSVKAVYDYQLIELTFPTPTLSAAEIQADCLWDVGLWDQCIWDGGSSAPPPFTPGSGRPTMITGASNMGRMVAIAIKGSTIEGVKLLSIDVIWKTGGAL